MIREIMIKITLESGAGEVGAEDTSVLVQQVEVAPPEGTDPALEPAIPPLPTVDQGPAEALPELAPPAAEGVEPSEEAAGVIPPVPDADPENSPARPARRRRPPAQPEVPEPPK
ncbi:MAG: hypothetical protein R6X16_16060 [Anaerolineae bacterium]